MSVKIPPLHIFHWKMGIPSKREEIKDKSPSIPLLKGGGRKQLIPLNPSLKKREEKGFSPFPKGGIKGGFFLKTQKQKMLKYNSNLKKFSRKLRNNQTEAERKLW